MSDESKPDDIDWGKFERCANALKAARTKPETLSRPQIEWVAKFLGKQVDDLTAELWPTRKAKRELVAALEDVVGWGTKPMGMAGHHQRARAFDNARAVIAKAKEESDG